MEAFANVGDMALMKDTAGDPRIGIDVLEKMIGAAQRTGQSELIPLLMDPRHGRKRKQEEQNREGHIRKRRFEL